MLLRRETLEGIRSGSISVQFRRWKRPTVKAGGTLLTAIGQLAIHEVEPVALEDVTAQDARAAGFDDLDALRSTLERAGSGTLYRIRLGLLGPDPRAGLREELPTGDDLDELLARLARMDGRATAGAWTARTLRLIRDRPGERAGDLAKTLGVETRRLKVDVRKLKGLGLTESLSVGYRLSPRGAHVLAALEAVRSKRRS